MKRLLKRVDVLNPRVLEESRVRTSQGGALFLVASAIAIVLTANSLRSFFLRPEIAFVERIQVDTQLSLRLPIDLNITFPSLSCADVELVALDVSGETQLDVTSSLKKTRLTADGHQIGDEIIGHLNRDKVALVEKKDRFGKGRSCGSCYGAEVRPNDCCYTCHDVKDRYAAKGWDVQQVSRTADQCLREMDHPEIAVQSNEGCNLAGSLSVNKVAGNINVALGMTRKFGGQVLHTYVQDQMGQFDTSHIIHKLRFGEEQAATNFGPLDGTSREVDHSLGRTSAIQYFVHLVPIRIDNKWSFRYTKTSKYIPILEPEDKLEVRLNTENQKHSASHGPKSMHKAFILPGIYFMYDFSPFVVIRERHEMLFIDLVIDLLTVAGGILALVRLFDYGLHFFGS